MQESLPGSFEDIEIMKENLQLHDSSMQNMSDEWDIEGNGYLINKNGDVLVVFPDKGYIGMERKIRLISPNKKPAYQNFTFAEQDFNNNHVTDRLLV